MLLDPFYGVFRVDTIIAKWLNRVLLVAELLVLNFSPRIFSFLRYDEFWRAIFNTVGVCLAMSLFNILLRKLWDVVMVIVYGTTDADSILAAHNRRVEKRQRRKKERQLRKLGLSPNTKGKSTVWIPSYTDYPDRFAK